MGQHAEVAAVGAGGPLRRELISSAKNDASRPFAVCLAVEGPFTFRQSLSIPLIIIPTPSRVEAERVKVSHRNILQIDKQLLRRRPNLVVRFDGNLRSSSFTLSVLLAPPWYHCCYDRRKQTSARRL